LVRLLPQGIFHKHQNTSEPLPPMDICFAPRVSTILQDGHWWAGVGYVNAVFVVGVEQMCLKLGKVYAKSMKPGNSFLQLQLP
jgi:hypothetical protein